MIANAWDIQTRVSDRQPKAAGRTLATRTGYDGRRNPHGPAEWIIRNGKPVTGRPDARAILQALRARLQA